MTPEALFGRHHLFATLAPQEAAELLAGVRRRQVTAGQTIFRRDDPGDGLYGVLSGRVVVLVTSAAGKELILNRFGPGEFFGEIALLDGKGRTATAVAREATSLMFLARRAFLPFLERRPEVAARMIAMLCERLRRTTEQMEDAAFRNVPARLAKQLGALAAASGGEAAVAIGQGELAQMLGVSREIISRQLGIWQEAGLVALARGRIMLHDRTRLERIVAGE
jgi:CRP/FNR family transcriptional regulator, cyclic AMP receptor protein